jgi:hypothetical protein
MGNTKQTYTLNETSLLDQYGLTSVCVLDVLLASATV